VGVLGVSRDLLKELPFGTQVVVYGRTYVVGDTMAARWRRRIDIPHPTYRGAMLHGVRRKVIMEVHR
jgi:3D (Asp-Asp-Asp) domain-containing protein